MYTNDSSEYSQGDVNSLKSKKMLEVACLSLRELQRMILTTKNQKMQSAYSRVKVPEIDVDTENQQYELWESIYYQKVRNNDPQPFRNSIYELFKLQLFFVLLIELLGYTIYSVTPFLLLRLYQNITAQRVHTFQNKILILIIVISRVFRILFSFYGEMKIKEIGLEMYRLTAYAIVRKTFRCSPLSNQNLSVSEMTKMMHNDCAMIMNYPTKLALVLDYSLNIIISTAIVIYVSGLSGFLGLLFMFATLFVRFLVKQKVQDIGQRLEKRSNARIKATIQTFNIIKFIKTNALQSCYFNKLRHLRVEEVSELKKKLFIEMIQNAANFLKFLSVVITTKLLVTFHAQFGIEIVLTVCLCISFTNTQAIINAIAFLEMISTSVRNIEDFMKKEEINWSHIKFVNLPSSPYSVEITNGDFSWSCNPQDDKAKTQSSPSHLKNINIKFKKGELVAIVGTFGSGKTSFVNSIIGEMNKKGNSQIAINGKIAYTTQNPWITNDTIRNNILFGSEYNEKRYMEAIKYACLESDLVMFPHGDLTIVGKKGSTLSGGQRARVSFARALYSKADIFILDDLLSAVDAHVGAFLFSISIKEHLKSKTVILITHSLYHVEHTDRILVFQNGEIKCQGTYQQLKQTQIFHKIESSTLKKTHQYEHILNKKIDVKEVTEIQLIEDHLQRDIGAWQSFKIYIKRNSGLPFVILISFYILTISGVSSYSQINLNYWAMSPVAQENIFFYIQLIVNFGLIALTVLLGFNLYLSKMYQTLHDDMIRSLLFAPLSFYEKISTDRIITRLSTDLNINDQVITSEFNYSLIHIRLLILTLFSIFYIFFKTQSYSYLGIFTALLVFCFYYFSFFYGFRNRIHNLQKDLITSFNGTYSELVDGLPTVRAFNRIEAVFSDFQSKMSTLFSASLIRIIIDGKIVLNILVMVNILGIMKIMSLLYIEEPFNELAIFLIFNIFLLQDAALKVNQNVIDFAPILESLGKCQDLTKVEPQPGYNNYLSNNWAEDTCFSQTNHSKQIFQNGEIVFENYSFKYRPELDSVLKNINLRIHSGEKIGIVGRTGSGKSTLMLGLLRIIEGSSGKILIDGKDTIQLSLEELRSNINIILQEHFLYNASIRENVDPSGTHSDQKIKEALQMCGIWEIFEQKQGLDTEIAEGGDNLSSGEKQLVNIARSLINPKKIVLIDEATASIDIKTDQLVQSVMRKQFADRTVLTIAHRINTVVDSDRILVLERGEIAQLDSPSNLLEIASSIFTKLYNDSGKTKED